MERTTQELNRLLKAGRTRERARIEQSQQTTYRQQIKNVSEKFQRMLLRPGKGATQHAPANLMGRCGTSASSSTIPRCGGRPGGS